MAGDFKIKIINFPMRRYFNPDNTNLKHVNVNHCVLEK